MIKIDTSKCAGCRLCIENCPDEVLDLVDGYVAPIRPELCEACLTCELCCPHEAITVVQECG